MTKFTLPKLPYSYDALEPYIDARTMEIHYTKHHQGYVNKLNAALEKAPDFQNIDLESLLSDIDGLPEDVRFAIRNNGGGHFNHSMFWKIMKKNGGGESSGPLGLMIKKEWGSFEAFQEEFNMAAKSVFGSGWAWLCISPENELVIASTVNQDNPLSFGFQPIMCLDVWEHAYYLKYQNKRPDYISAFWHVINWEQVEENYNKIVS